MNSTPLTLVATAEALSELCADLATSRWLALDTEFLRERTYYPQLCLLQVAGEEQVACVDVIALPNIGPLLNLLQRPDITKVVHAGRQDLEIFHHVYGVLPGPIFDTQLAAALLLGADQIGYAALVEKLLGVRLDKAHTRADWSRRPLSQEELAYALDDVRYLGPLYLQLQEQLRAAGRLGWLEGAFAELLRTETYVIDPAQAWRRIKDSQRMRGIELVALQAIAAWREREAMRANLPRRWVVSDEVAADLARRRPQKEAELAKLRGVDGRLVSRYGSALIEVIAQACATPKAQWPVPEQRRALAPNEEALVDMLVAAVKVCAAQAGVTPAMVATRGHLEDLVRHGDSAPRLEGWRDAVAGEGLRALLAGVAQLGVQEGRAALLTATVSDAPAHASAGARLAE